jgi:hypothetical protein
MAFPYTRAQADWKNASAATGGGDTSTPITEAALDTIESGIKSLSDLLAGAATDEVLTALSATSTDWIKLVNVNIASNAAIARSKLAVETRHLPIQITGPYDANSFPTMYLLTGYQPYVWEFVKDVDGYVFWQARVPDGLAATPNAKVVLEIIANATSGVTRLGVSSKNAADGATMNSSLTVETEQDITVPGTAYFRKKVSFTLTNAPAAGDLLYGNIKHAGAHANDTLAVDTLLLGAWLQVDVS